MLASAESGWLDRLEAEQREKEMIGMKNLQLSRNLDAARIEIDEWKMRCQHLEAEKKEMSEAHLLRLKTREQELNSEKKESLQLCIQQHSLQIDTLKEQLRVLQSNHQIALEEWKSAADQVIFRLIN